MCGFDGEREIQPAWDKVLAYHQRIYILYMAKLKRVAPQDGTYHVYRPHFGNKHRTK